MTYDKYWAEIGRRLANKEYANQRLGQLCFNLLYEVKPTLADIIRSSSIDPFFLDCRVGEFAIYIYKNWN